MKKRVVSLLLSLSMLLCSTVPVFADTITVTGDADTSEATQNVEVTAQKGATFVVALPSMIELSEETFYELKVGLYAEIDSSTMLVVEPVDSMIETAEVIDFSLVNIVTDGVEAKPDIIVEVTPVNTEWLYDSEDFCDDVNDITLEDNLVLCSTMKVEEIPTGKWSGNLSMRIALEEIPASLGVSIVDTADTDLNGVATFITGDTKTTLLNELVDSGYIANAGDIDALVDVNCDAFLDTATATFNVKSFAQPSDRIVIYHYDEEFDVWDYIDTVIVGDDGTVTCEFSSFSPVGFSNIGQVDENHEHDYIESLVRESTCVLNGANKFVCECGDIYVEKLDLIDHDLDTDSTCKMCHEYIFGVWVSDSRYQITDEDTITIDIFNPGGHEIVVSNSDSSVVSTTLQDGGVVITAVKEGVATITLSVGSDTYGAEEISFLVDVSHKYVNGTCDRCGEIDVTQLPAGLYNTDWTLKTSWDTLLSNRVLYVTDGVLTSNYDASDTSQITNSSSSALNGIIVIPEGVTKLSNTFSRCDYLQGIVFPSSVEVLSGNCFYSKNSQLSTIIVKPENRAYKTVDGILYNIDMTELIKYPVNKTATTFEIPSSVKTINNSSFQSNKYLKTISIPNGVTKIGGGAFDRCSNLTSVVLSETVEFIGNWAFFKCPLTSIRLPDNLKFIGGGALGGTKLSKIYIPESCTTITVETTSTYADGPFAENSSGMKIYCGASSKPEGWAEGWDRYGISTNLNTDKLSVTWGVTREQYDAL